MPGSEAKAMPSPISEEEAIHLANVHLHSIRLTDYELLLTRRDDYSEYPALNRSGAFWWVSFLKKSAESKLDEECNTSDVVGIVVDAVTGQTGVFEELLEDSESKGKEDFWGL